MEYYKLIVPLLVCCFIGISQGVSQETENAFEKDIRAFEKADEENMPEPGGILFVGSSSIRAWYTLSEDFSKYPVINRGFGGSQIEDVIHFFDRVVAKYQPSQIVLYSGDNDIAVGKSSERVFSDFKEFAGMVKEKLPGTELIVLSIKPSTLRWSMYPDMEAVNKKMKYYAQRHQGVEFVDVSSDMLTADGVPDESLLLDDGIHMTPEGYEIWTNILEPYLKKL